MSAGPETPSLDDDREALDWTPSTEQVRAHYVFNQSDQWDPERGAAFDRWLAGLRRQGPITHEQVSIVWRELHAKRRWGDYSESAVRESLESAGITVERAR